MNPACPHCQRLTAHFNNTAPARQVRCRKGHMVTLGYDLSVHTRTKCPHPKWGQVYLCDCEITHLPDCAVAFNDADESGEWAE